MVLPANQNEFYSKFERKHFKMITADNGACFRGSHPFSSRYTGHPKTDDAIVEMLHIQGGVTQ